MWLFQVMAAILAFTIVGGLVGLVFGKFITKLIKFMEQLK